MISGYFTFDYEAKYVIPSAVKRSRGICSKNTADPSTAPPAGGCARDDKRDIYANAKVLRNSKYFR